MTNKPIAKCWSFPSSSSSKTYQTLQYTDGSTSCDCMGWTRHVAADGSRCCKHTRAVEMGTADRQAESVKEYGSVQSARPVEQKVITEKAVKQGIRRIRI